MPRRKAVQDLPAAYTAEYAQDIQWAEDLGRIARLTNTKPDYSKIPQPLRPYTRSAYKGYLAKVEAA